RAAPAPRPVGDPLSRTGPRTAGPPGAAARTHPRWPGRAGVRPARPEHTAGTSPTTRSTSSAPRPPLARCRRVAIRLARASATGARSRPHRRRRHAQTRPSTDSTFQVWEKPTALTIAFRGGGGRLAPASGELYLA